MSRRLLINITIGFCAILFIIVASVIAIIIAQGKKIGDDGQIITTSIIRINAIPSDVKAYINGQEATINDDKIENIDPGVVNLKLTKDGYAPWEKSITIEAGVVKDIYAQLYPETIKFQKFINTNIDKFYGSKDQSSIFYTVINSTDPTQNGIWQIRLSKSLLDFSSVNDPKEVFKFNSTITALLKKSKYELDVSNNNSKILLKLPDEKLFYLYDNSQPNGFSNVNDLLTFSPDNVEWLRDPDSLLVQKDNLLLEYDIASGQSTIVDVGEKPAPSHTVTQNSVYFVKNFVLYKYANKNSVKAILPLDSTTTDTKILAVNSARDNPSIIILTTQSGLYFIDFSRTYAKLIDPLGTFYSISSNGREVIYANAGQLYTFSLDDSIDGKSYVVSKANLQINTADTLGVFFSPSLKNLLVIDSKKKIQVMDNDGQNKASILDEFDLAQPNLFIDKESAELYALVADKLEDNTTQNLVFKFDLEIPTQ